MEPFYADERVTLWQGDNREILRQLPAQSVQCAVTSPPYWGLRDYGVDGQIGLEQTVEEYVAGLVGVFAAVKRVLRDDGTLWLNLGDCYSSGTGGDRRMGEFDERRGRAREQIADLGPKQLVGLPWRVAFALQADGWTLRQDIIWSKSNCMPESVTDRPTKSHEYLFLLAKSPRYYYDAEAIKEPAGPFKPVGPGSRADNDRDPVHGTRKQDALGKQTYTGFNGRWRDNPATGRNRRSVWTVATSPYSEAHFATYPPALIEPCILAGTSERGACPHCGKPWERVVERRKCQVTNPRPFSKAGNADRNDTLRVYEEHEFITTGWRQACACQPAEPVPCVVLDPFAGSFTTGQVAVKHRRRAWGIELNPDYCAMSVRRFGRTQVALGL